MNRWYRTPVLREVGHACVYFPLRVVYGLVALLPAALACLRRNECLALLPDKRLRAARITVDFFGRRVRVPSTPALLSWRTGAPLLTGGALRIGDTARFRLVHGEPIRPDATVPKGREIRRLSQAWTTALEQLIRLHPEQWIWTHDRFKQSALAESAQPESASTRCRVLR